MPNIPKLSIIIPAYNYAEKVAHAVLSVVEQLTSECELIVINDGSTDNTAQVLQQLLDATDNAFRVVTKPNGGLASVRNLGIELAQSDYFIFLDADDRLYENAIQNILECLAANPQAEMVIGGTVSVWANESRKKESLPGPLPATAMGRVRGYLLDKTVSPSNGATVMHRNIFNKGKYPEHFRNSEDIPVFAQALANNNCLILKVPLAYIYKSPTSLRHNVEYHRQVGLHLVDEIFESGRLSNEYRLLKKPFVSQRALSLFRGYYLAGLYKEARQMYCFALKNSWASALKLSYTRKYLRVLFK